MTQQEAEVILKVNDQQARDKLEKLQSQAEDLRTKFAEAFKKGDTKAIAQINKDLQKVNKEINNMRTNAANISAAMERLDEATPKELRRTIKMINDELNSGRVKRGSEEWQMYTERLQEVNEELEALLETQHRSEGFFTSFTNKFTQWWGTYTILSDAISNVKMKFSQMKQDMRDKEESQANLQALTGLDDSSIQWLTEQAELLSTTMDESGLRITQSSKEILDAYMLVGSNKPELLTDKKALNDVTIEAMRLAAAAKMELQPAVDAMTTSLNQYGEGADQAARYVNVLAAGSKFGAANVKQQSASILKAGTAAASANVSFEELVGSIEMLGEKGIKGEVAGTGLKKFFLVLQTGAAETNPKVVGLSTALDNLKSQVDAAEKESVGGGASFLKKMFGEEAYSIASILSDNTQKVKEYTEAVTATQTATEQAAINSDTSAAKLDQMRNKFKEAGIELIEKLNPSLGILANWSSKLISILPTLFDILINCRTTILTLTTAIVAYNLYLQKSIILDKTKAFWQNIVVAGYKRLIAVIRSNAWGFAAAGVALLIGGIIDLVRASNRASAAQKDLNDIRNQARSKMAEEKTEIELLVAAARNESNSLDERRKAINRLNEIIPDYNASLDATTGKYNENKTALDKYITSLTRKYELEGAREKLAKIGAEKADAQIELDKAQKVADNAKKNSESGGGHTYTTSFGMVSNTATDLVSDANRVLAKAEAKMEEIKTRERAILDSYGVDLQKQAIKDATPDPSKTDDGNNNPKNNPDGDIDKANVELKKLTEDLETLKKEYLAYEAQNLASYVTGTIDYEKYLAEKERLDAEHLKKQIETHENHNKIDIAGYVRLLAQRAKNKQSADEKEHQLDLKAIEQRHKTLEDGIIKDFYNPDGNMFQNEVALNQRLLEEDLRYLAEKRDAYQQGSEEYAAIESEIGERIAKDQLDKQKKLAEELKRIRKEYLGDESQQMQTELEILDKLHEAGLVSEEEYQRAIAAIKDKYRNREEEKSSEATSTIANDLIRFKDDFDDLINSFGEGWEKMIDNIGKLAESAYTIMSGYLNLYMSYANASRDLELAKVEKRYDDEIKAAGKNQKKKKKLEEQKEAEVAKIKKKYNDRAMKMELAQAIAQTAIAAINAYASASKASWVLGPIAAAMATAAGAIQIATIKKQHEAEAVGYYEGGFTTRDSNNRKEVGVVHANEFVANHDAVANPALSPVLRLIDHAQRNNTVGSLTAADVSQAIGNKPWVGSGGSADYSPMTDALSGSVALMADITAATRHSLDRLSDNIENGIETYMVMDGEQGFHKKYEHFKKLKQNPKR